MGNTCENCRCIIRTTSIRHFDERTASIGNFNGSYDCMLDDKKKITTSTTCSRWYNWEIV